jgi:hypothetical protein
LPFADKLDVLASGRSTFAPEINERYPIRPSC